MYDILTYLASQINNRNYSFFFFFLIAPPTLFTTLPPQPPLPILIYIYKSLPHQYILQNTTFNIKLTNEYDDYVYYPEINMSIQHKNANETIKEIINMIVMNTYSLDIRFKLETGEIVNYQQ